MYTFNDKKLYLYIKVLSSCGEIVFVHKCKIFFLNKIGRIILPQVNKIAEK